jgi:hypothetical protein
MKLYNFIPNALSTCWIALTISVTMLPLASGQNCPLTLWVFPNIANCNSFDDPTSIGTIYADGECHTLDDDMLFPGNYAAECTSDGSINFIHSGCLSDTCAVSGSGDICDADSSATASLYGSYQVNRPVQDPGSISSQTYSCFFIKGGISNELYVSFLVYGDCSKSAGCQIDGVAAAPVRTPTAPVRPPTAPVAVPNKPVPTPIKPAPTTVSPVAAPIATQSPTRAPTVVTSVPTSMPTISPTSFPSFVPSAVVVVVVAPTSTTGQPNNNIMNRNDTAPFRNSTIQGKATIFVNTSLILPPPATGISETIAVFPSNGGILIQASDRSIEYRPNFNFVGTDVFEIRQCHDGSSSSENADCETLRVVVVVAAQSGIDPPTESNSSSSSSSNGIYGLAALAIIPILLVYAYRKKAICGASSSDSSKDESIVGQRIKGDVVSHSDGTTMISGMGTSLAGSSSPSRQHPGSLDVTKLRSSDSHDDDQSHTTNVSDYATSFPNPVHGSGNTKMTSARGSSTSTKKVHAGDGSAMAVPTPLSVVAERQVQGETDAYQVDVKDQCRDVRLSSQRNWLAGTNSEPIHPLAAQLMHVRSSGKGATTASTKKVHAGDGSAMAVPTPLSVVAEPQAQAITDSYQVDVKDQCRDVRLSIHTPVIVNAILISDDEDIHEFSNETQKEEDAKFPSRSEL